MNGMKSSSHIFQGFGGLVMLVLIFVAAPFLGMGAYGLYRNLERLKTYIHVSGVVVANQSDYSDSALFPRVEFKTREGERMSFLDGVGSYPADYMVGESVQVIYNSANPKMAEINASKRLWLVPILFLVLGASFVGVGIFIARKINSV